MSEFAAGRKARRSDKSALDIPAERPDYSAPGIQRQRAIDFLVREMARAMASLPGHWPQNLELAAARWVDWLQEPISYPSELPARLDGGGMIEPYIARVVQNLRKYLALPPGERQYIESARDDGIWWRGDEMDMFRRIIVAETPTY